MKAIYGLPIPVTRHADGSFHPITEADRGGVATVELGIRYFAETPANLAAWVIRGCDSTGTWTDIRRFTDKEQFDAAVRDLYRGVTVDAMLAKAY